jgi:hypothetical protein
MELQGAERDDKHVLPVERYPGFAEYQRMTSRTIPVVATHTYRYGGAARMKALATGAAGSPPLAAHESGCVGRKINRRRRH